MRGEGRWDGVGKGKEGREEREAKSSEDKETEKPKYEVPDDLGGAARQGGRSGMQPGDAARRPGQALALRNRAYSQADLKIWSTDR